MIVIDLEIRCPRCGRKLRAVTGHGGAAVIVPRRCSNGHRWILTITKVEFTEGRAGHRLDWLPLDPMSAALDKSYLAAAKADAR